MKPIVPGLYTFTGMVAGRVYLIEDGDGLTLIDTSLAQSASRILSQLEAAGHKASDVRRILITHAHPDHIGGLPEVQRRTGAQVVASAGEAAVIEGKARMVSSPTTIGRRMSRLAPKQIPVAVERVVKDGDVLDDVMGGMQIVSIPGHAPDHIAFWQPERRILFCGDVVMHLFNGLHLPFALVTVDMAEDIRSVGRIAALRPDVICFGHGAPLTRNAASELSAFAAKVL